MGFHRSAALTENCVGIGSNKYPPFQLQITKINSKLFAFALLAAAIFNAHSQTVTISPKKSPVAINVKPGSGKVASLVNSDGSGCNKTTDPDCSEGGGTDVGGGGGGGGGLPTLPPVVVDVPQTPPSTLPPVEVTGPSTPPPQSPAMPAPSPERPDMGTPVETPTTKYQRCQGAKAVCVADAEIMREQRFKSCELEKTTFRTAACKEVVMANYQNERDNICPIKYATCMTNP